MAHAHDFAAALNILTIEIDHFLSSYSIAGLLALLTYLLTYLLTVADSKDQLVSWSLER